jgi:hypothetical protein
MSGTTSFTEGCAHPKDEYNLTGMKSSSIFLSLLTPNNEFRRRSPPHSLETSGTVGGARRSQSKLAPNPS